MYVINKQIYYLYLTPASDWLVKLDCLFQAISSLATIQILSSAYSRVYSQLLSMSGMIKLPVILAKTVTTNTLVSICFIFLYNDCIGYHNHVGMLDARSRIQLAVLCDRVT